jgi:hypothetical protein
MKRKPLVAAVSAALGVTVLSSSACASPAVKSVEFLARISHQPRYFAPDAAWRGWAAAAVA